MLANETKLINESIQAYKNTVTFLKSQILYLERKKLIKYTDTDECLKCFKVINKKENR